MRRLLACLCLIVAIFLGSAEFAESADFDKGLKAARAGDYKTALRELKPLADQGHSIAQGLLGDMYYSGYGVAQNYTTAMMWYLRSATQGNPIAQYSVGMMYDSGKGVAENDKEAVKWFLKAGEQGDTEAHHRLGTMYYHGRGVSENFHRAYMWWALAAAKGSKKSKHNLEILNERMARAQKEFAKEMTRECVRTNYKGC